MSLFIVHCANSDHNPVALRTACASSHIPRTRAYVRHLLRDCVRFHVRDTVSSNSGLERALHAAGSWDGLVEWLFVPIYIQSCMVSSAFAPTRVLASWLSKRALCKALPQLFKPERPTRVDGRGGSQRGFCAVLGADPCRAHSKCIPAPLGASVLYAVPTNSKF